MIVGIPLNFACSLTNKLSNASVLTKLIETMEIA